MYVLHSGIMRTLRYGFECYLNIHLEPENFNPSQLLNLSHIVRSILYGNVKNFAVVKAKEKDEHFKELIKMAALYFNVLETHALMITHLAAQLLLGRQIVDLSNVKPNENMFPEGRYWGISDQTYFMPLPYARILNQEKKISEQ